MDLKSKEATSAVLYGVSYVPNLACNLFSVKSATQRWNRVHLNKILAVIAVYVDDLILITETEDEMFRVKKDLKAKFQMKDMGQLHSTLNWITRRAYCGFINICTS